MVDVTKILELIKDPDLKLKINELYGENIKLKEENHELKKKIEQLEEVKELSSKLLHEDNHYFIVDGDKKDGPYCTKCWDANRKLIRLHKGDFNYGEQYYRCPNCDTSTHTGTYNPPPPPQREPFDPYF